MSEEEFFERLHDRAHNKYPKMLHGDWADGIEATIEALKEMMVGYPRPMRLEYFGDGMLLRDQNDEVHASYPYRLNCADGEEVVSLVVRLG